MNDKYNKLNFKTYTPLPYKNEHKKDVAGMKAVKKDLPGRGISITSAPIPEPGPDEVLIKVNMAGICGTDLHIYKWDEWSQKRIKPPVILGKPAGILLNSFGR